MPDFLSTPWNALQVVLAFGVVILIHELGHFLAARYNGVRVLKFAIGFDFGGWKLWSRTVGGTEYVVGAFPLGGYVRMLGQEDLPGESEESSGKPPEDSFQAKTVWQRMQIISAGVVMNFLSAFVFCYLALTSGFEQTAPEVGSVGFASLQAGLRPGDRIEKLDGTPTATWMDVEVAYMTAAPGEMAAVEVLRQGTPLALSLPVLREPGAPVNQPDFSAPVSLQISQVITETPEGPTAAAKAGIQPGDVIRALDGHPLATWEEFSRAVRSRAGVSTRLLLDRPQDARSQTFTPVEVTLTPSRQPDELTGRWWLGADPAEPPRLDMVVKGLAADRAGVKEGDTVVSVDGKTVSSWREFWLRTEYAPGGIPISLELRDGGGGVRSVQVIPEGPDHWRGLGVWGVFGLGVAHRVPDAVVVGAVTEGSPAARAGLQAGDRLVEMSIASSTEGSSAKSRTLPIASWTDLYAAMATSPTREISLTWERRGVRESKPTPLAENPEPRWRGLVGVSTSEKKAWMDMGPVEAIGPALRQPFTMLAQFYTTLKALFLGRVGTETLSGPVGISMVIWHAAQQSLGELFNWLALISINLAVVNFLPIPITDGGHFLFLLYEKVRGRRMGDEIQAGLQWVGLLFLLLIFVFATWNDLSRLIGRG